jgi:hypothetical protein
MIIDKLVKLKIGGRNIKHFRSINPEYKIYQEIEIPVELLTEGSNIKINCLCDLCGKKRYISYQKYRDSEKLYGGYNCQKCSHKKREKTSLIKYGNKNYMGTESFKKKVINIINEKYGCDNIFQNEIIKDRIKEVNLQKYGVEYISQNEEIHKKIVKSSYKKNELHGLVYQGYFEKDFIERYYNKIKISKIDPVEYYLDKKRIYFPDFFIEEINLIVEIKSSYTYKLHEEKNLAKMNACKNIGYNFIFIIDKNYDEFEKIIYND